MKITSQQLKDLVENIFNKHSTSNEDFLTVKQLYDFFNAVLKTPVTYIEVQQTLRQVHTASNQKITKREMYQTLKRLINGRKQPLRERENDKNMGNRDVSGLRMEKKGRVERVKSEDKMAKPSGLRGLGNPDGNPLDAHENRFNGENVEIKFNKAKLFYSPEYKKM